CQRRGGRAGGYGGFGCVEDVLKEGFGGVGRSGQAGFRFEQGDRPGQDISAALTITLAEAAEGTDKRVQLPTGREVDVKIPAGLNDGQVIRLKGQGLGGSSGRAGGLLITVSGAPPAAFTRR